MGRLFLVDLEGRTYNCKVCKTQLALVDDLISKALHCRRGKAYLFNNVVNITVGPLEERPMISGMHTVADIFCCCCGQIVGCKYVVLCIYLRQESAHESSQKYKEGKFSLERGKIIDNMKPRNSSQPFSHPGGTSSESRYSLSFQEQVLAQLGNMQTWIGSIDSQLGSFESRVAGLEVKLDEIYAWLQKGMGQHGEIPEPSCARTIPISVQDAAQIFSAGPSRRDELGKQMPSFESLQTSIGSFIRWLGSLDSQVAGPADDDSAFEEQVLAQLESLQTSVGSINNRFRSLDSRITALEVKLDGIQARLPPAPPSHLSQAP